MFKHILQIMADRFYSYTNLTFEALNLHREKFTLEKIVSQGLIRKDHVYLCTYRTEHNLYKTVLFHAFMHSDLG